MARTAASSRILASAEIDHGQKETIAMCWSCVLEMWRIGHRYYRLKPARDRLYGQLCQPGAEQREGYREADARLRRWDAELMGHDMRADGLRKNLAKHHGFLSRRNRAELIGHAGWSQASDSTLFAQQMWEQCRDHVRWPAGEPNFDLAPLQAWVDGGLERERQAMAMEATR